MYTISVPKRIHQMISIFYFLGLWNDDNRADFVKIASNLWFLGVYGLFTISIFGGALTSENEAETIFLANMSIVTSVQTVRLYYLLWKKGEILQFIQKFCTHSINNDEDFKQVSKKISNFVNFITIFEFGITGGVVTMIVLALPIVSNERRLPLNLYVPWHWKESEIVYWMVFLIVMYQIILGIVCVLFNMIIWYLMMSCGTTYKILGNEFREIGFIDEVERKILNNKISLARKQRLVLTELITQIQHHRHLQVTTSQFKMCFANIFFIQIFTSGLTICASVYALAFNSAVNPFQYGFNVVVLFYNLFDIFMVTYFGNEIKVLSCRLAYCLFECNWIDQSKSCKKCIFTLMEVLKRPQVLVVGKLYPLDLEIFTKILNFAYSMFNMLIKLK